MTIDEAIKHCEQVASDCGNKSCSMDHKQLSLWLIELKAYRKRYGILSDLYPSITVTKSNLDKESIRVDEIENISVSEGVFEGNHYHTRLYCKNHTYYVIETVDEVNGLISKATNKQ